MASVTFATDSELKARLEKFSWVNWSEVGREAFLKKSRLEEIRDKIASEEDLINWSVQLGRKAKKEAFRKILSKLK
ncbi:hypothetical protein JXA85_08765 [Candidatus Woesearchaeota archaeon]|nr:hypothetical protein [Candidatus Woesearchaeota archaeon]